MAASVREGGKQVVGKPAIHVGAGADVVSRDHAQTAQLRHRHIGFVWRQPGERTAETRGRRALLLDQQDAGQSHRRTHAPTTAVATQVRRDFHDAQGVQRIGDAVRLRIGEQLLDPVRQDVRSLREVRDIVEVSGMQQQLDVHAGDGAGEPLESAREEPHLGHGPRRTEPGPVGVAAFDFLTSTRSRDQPALRRLYR